MRKGRFEDAHKNLHEVWGGLILVAPKDPAKREAWIQSLREANARQFAVPGAREKHSELNKKRFEDPNEREKVSIGVSKYFEEHPEAKDLQSKNALEYFKDPINKEKYMAAHKKAFEDPDVIMKISVAQKKRFEDPSEREKSSIAHKKAYEDDPDLCKRVSDGIKRAWEGNDELHKRASDSANKRWEDPTEREKASEKTIEYFKDPIARKLNSDRQKKRLEDPLEIEKLSIAVRKAHADDPMLRIRMGEIQKKSYAENPSRRENNSKSHMGVLVGPRNPRWRGGITPLNNQVRSCTKMKVWITSVFERDNYRDWFSGCTGQLEAHHIVPFKKLMVKNNIKTLKEAEMCKELWDINNGITLLKTSHKAYHDMWGHRR